MNHLVHHPLQSNDDGVVLMMLHLHVGDEFLLKSQLGLKKMMEFAVELKMEGRRSVEIGSLLKNEGKLSGKESLQFRKVRTLG